MIRLHKLLIFGLFVCLATSQRASSQTLEEDHLTTQVVPRKAAKAGKNRGSLIIGAIPNSSPGLCFQPGIGWQHVPTGKPNGSDMPGCGDSNNIEATKSTATESSASVYAQHSGNKQAIARGIEMGSTVTGSRGQAAAPSDSSSINTGALASLSGNVPFNPASGATSGRQATAMSSMPPGGMHLSSGHKPEISADQVKDLGSHAYVSPITVRRMIRNTSDLQTRIKLQELQSKLSNKSPVSTVSSNVNQSRKGRSKTLHVSKADSSSMSGGHSRAGDAARTLHSHSYQ
jgi:hypothetical protein